MFHRVVWFLLLLVAAANSSLVVISRHLRRDLLATHNFYRRQVGAANMRRLEWDESLESAATKRAASCNVKGAADEHSYGENVYVAEHIGHYRGLVAIALQSWANDGYNYTVMAYDTGHNVPRYTQLTWAGSHRLGCAISKCHDIDDEDKTVQDSSILVCLYDPKGNIPMQYPYELSGRKCSHCPGGTHCDKGLCVDGFMMMDQAFLSAGMKPTFEEKPQPIQPFSGTCNGGERWLCECRSTIAELNSPAGQLTETEKNLIVEVHNSYRDNNNLNNIAWDIGLEIWAKYVIRCEPLYPGPKDCYTNFGKGEAGAPITNVVDNWAADNQAVKSNEPWCRTPFDSAVCNRNTNLMQEKVIRIGCEAMACGDKRQLTCIYRIG